MVATDCAHIELRDGVPFIADTATKVVLLAESHLVNDWDGAELQRHFPHLSRGQVYAALAYFYDHMDEFQREMERREQMAQALRPVLEDPAQRARLIAAKRARTSGGS